MVTIPSRQKSTTKVYYDANGNPVKKCYCRRCMEFKPPNKFLDATDNILDKNGKMSVCSECVEDIFQKTYVAEQDLPKTILIVCRLLNVVYLENGVQSTMSHVEKMYEKQDNPDLRFIFSFYKAKVTSLTQINQSGVLTFTEPAKFYTEDDFMERTTDEDAADLKQFWGEGLSLDDYNYLEREMSEWKTLEIKKQRLGNNSTASLVKELQDLMKTASVDPAKTAIAGAGKSQDTFSAFIKTIEENEPAEYYKDRKLFKDYDNIDWYFRKYVLRPLRNFVLQARDFNVDEKDDDLDESEVDISDILGDENA
jgi:hypothetical protein